MISATFFNSLQQNYVYVDIKRNEKLFYSIYMTFYFIKQPYILSILVVLAV
jgi:hypothetical protein